MPVYDYGLGGRIPLIDPREMNEACKKTYDLMNATMIPWAKGSGFEAQVADGKMIGPFNGFLLTPEITAAFLALQKAEGTYTTLSDELRQVIILTVGAVWNCDYELYAHAAVARKIGIAGSMIDALIRGEPATELSAEAQLAQRFTREFVERHHMSEDVYTQAVLAFGTPGIVSIIHLAGCYMTIASLLNVLKVPAPRQSASHV